MKLKKLKRAKVFIPEWNGNKKEKAGNQIEVEITSYPSGAQVGEYKSYRIKDGMVEVHYNNALAMVNHVGNLKNLDIGNDKIDTAVKLCDYEDARLYPLIVEIREFLLKESEDLDEGEA